MLEPDFEEPLPQAASTRTAMTTVSFRITASVSTDCAERSTSVYASAPETV